MKNIDKGIIQRIASYCIVVCAITSIYVPNFRILMFLFIVCVQGFLFIHADFFSHQAKKSARWKTYRFLTYLSLVSCILFFLTSFYKQPAIEMKSWMIFLLLLIFGNYAPKLPYNATLGLRLPWTIATQATWRYAHQMVGFWTLPCSAVYLMGILLGQSVLCAAALLCWVLIPSITSYQYDRKRRNFE